MLNNMILIYKYYRIIEKQKAYNNIYIYKYNINGIVKKNF